MKKITDTTLFNRIRSLFDSGFIVPKAYADGFSQKRFRDNCRRTLYVSVFLFFEQLLYALFVFGADTFVRNIFLFSSLAMLVFALIAFRMKKKPPRKIMLIHRVFSIALAFFGMAVALRRFFATPMNDFYLPTVYIAVLYGVAVIFFLSIVEGLVFYMLIAGVTIALVPLFHEQSGSSVYIADIVSNTLIAWLISLMNYRNYLNNYSKGRIISEKNAELAESNDRITYMNKRLLEISEKDPLTKLNNRRKLDSILHLENERARRHGTVYSVIILDLDLFKDINDSHGHAAGDETLKHLALILNETLRSIDDCGRWGGEEFIIVCKETRLHEAALLAERLRTVIHETPFASAGTISASFGVASSEELCDVDGVLRMADERLYIAKRKGRNCVISTGSKKE